VTGYALAHLATAPRTQTLLSENLIVLEPDRLAATGAGRRILNAVTAEIATDLNWLADRTTPARD